jgi:Holliday junction resolvase YEN1
MESIVKVGVPLTVEDWEAGRQTKQKPRRAAAVQDPVNTSSASKAKRTKKTGDMPQAPIDRFATVTKPGSRLSLALAKTQDIPLNLSQANSRSEENLIDLLSSSPVAEKSTAPTPQFPRQKSPSPVLPELPSSVTKQRR